MNKSHILTTGIIVFILLAGTLLGSCTVTSTPQIKVVTTTSLLHLIVQRVGGELVEVANIIPPAQCPGHFDVKPGDIQKLAEADLFLLHSWQGDKFNQELIESANNPDLAVVVIDMLGNLTPTVQAEAADLISAALCQVDSANSETYQQAAAEYRSTVAAKEIQLRAELAAIDLSQLNVICAEQQAGFLVWAGCNVVASYGRPDSLTPQVVQGLVDTGRSQQVTLIVDNLQSGQDAGASIAEELDCTRIILTNFPGGFNNTETWEQAIDYNIQRLLEAIGR